MLTDVTSCITQTFHQLVYIYSHQFTDVYLWVLVKLNKLTPKAKVEILCQHCKKYWRSSWIVEVIFESLLIMTLKTNASLQSKYQRNWDIWAKVGGLNQGFPKWAKWPPWVPWAAKGLKGRVAWAVKGPWGHHLNFTLDILEF